MVRLKDHVLDEVGDSVEGERLVAGARGDPNAHGDGADVGDGLGEDEQAVGQSGAADAAGRGGGGGQSGDFDHATPNSQANFHCVTWIG